MHVDTIVCLVLSLVVGALAVLQQEPDFPILSLLTYWSEADDQKDVEALGIGGGKDIIDSASSSGKGGVIQVRTDKELHLKCYSATHHPTHRQLQWHFLPCGPGYNQTSCKVLRSSLTTDTEWQLVQSRNQLGELIFETPTKADSGLYKCTTFRHDRTFKVLRMFQLEVIDGTVHPPEIVEGPWNVSVACCSADQRVSLQCRVKSSVQPNIVWFRRLGISAGIGQENMIIYRNAAWKMLPSNQIYLGNQMYLSKLSFDQPATEDSGYYACLAINYKGWLMQGAQLTIYLPSSVAPLSSAEKDEEWGGLRFSGLFLIPACLALVPASAWLCYLYHKPRTKHTTTFIS